MATKYNVLFLLVTAISIVNQISAAQLKSLKILSELKQMEFEFPTSKIRDDAIANNLYIPMNAVPIDVDIDYTQGKSRVFVTIPRFTVGIPVTLGILSPKNGLNGTIQPYPDYNWHSSHGKNCDGLTSVFRVAIDECQRLWVTDAGSVGENQFCPPQIVVFDLKTDRLIHRYKFAANLFRAGLSLFVTPVVDVRDPAPVGNCTNTMVYMADVSGFGVVVYDYKRNVAWRAQNKYFFPNPDNGTYSVKGESFDLMDGVLGMALSPRSTAPRAPAPNHTNKVSPSKSSNRYLYFHSLASTSENRVPLSVLDNETAWHQNPEFSPRSFVKIGSRNSQSAAQAMDSNGNLFFGLVSPIAIGCWDSKRPYTEENMRVVAQNDETLQFATGVKVVLNKKGKEELWVLTDRFQRVMTGSISSREVNFRIQWIQIDDLLIGNECTRSGVPLNAGNSFKFF